MTILDTRLASSRDAVEQAVSTLDGCLDACLSDHTARDLFLLACVEAINNAAEHGNHWDAAKTIRLAGQFGPGLAVFFVEDQGDGFNPRFPDLTKVVGKRGRGLGFIKQFSDGVWFGPRGTQVALWKGCPSMVRDLRYSTATVATLPGDILVVSEFAPHANLFEAVGELLDDLDGLQWRRLFLNLDQVRLVNSTVWGSVFAEAGKERAELLVLFNCTPPVLSAAAAMGIASRKDDYAKIVVGADTAEAFRLLCQSLEQVNP